MNFIDKLREKPAVQKAEKFFPAVAFLAGCASIEPLRSTRFVDDENNYLHVDYGRDTKDHESVAILDNGVRWPFKTKNMVRVELPDGTSFIAYQNLAPAGNLYKTENEEWEFFF